MTSLAGSLCLPGRGSNRVWKIGRRIRTWSLHAMIRPMPALIIVDIEVTDPVRYEDYTRLASAAIAAHGGRYLVRGGKAEVLDGEWQPRRLVVLEFDSFEKAKAWRESAEYAEAKRVRETCARANMIVVEGV